MQHEYTFIAGTMHTWNTSMKDEFSSIFAPLSRQNTISTLDTSNAYLWLNRLLINLVYRSSLFLYRSLSLDPKVL